MSEQERALRRRLQALEEEIMLREQHAELEDIQELEGVRQVLQVFYDALRSARLNPTFLSIKKVQLEVRPEIINSFDPTVRVQLLCLLNNVCPATE